jgi:uncharacterized membrane protein YagU involved in acid resistance
MNKVLRGALAGAVATVPMSVVMTTVQRTLPAREQYPLPPKEITAKLADDVGIQDNLKEPELNALTMLAHYGYGALGGGAYALAEGVLPGRPAVKGMLFAMGVWTGSYLGWLPTANILKPVTEHPVRRTVLMITAHLVWGASFGVVEARLREGRAKSDRPPYVTRRSHG